MTNKQVSILEQLSMTSSFDEERANGLWRQLFKTINKNYLSCDDQNNIRMLFSSTKKFTANVAWVKRSEARVSVLRTFTQATSARLA